MRINTKRGATGLGSAVSDRTLGCLLGGILGMLLSCCLGIGVLMLSGAPPEASTAPPPPSAYDVEAIIEEDYINRTFLNSVPALPQPVRLIDGYLDIHPGGVADFAARVDLGLVQPVFRGTIALEPTETGGLDVTLVHVSMGHIPVTMFVPRNLLEDVDQDVNRQLMERTGAADVQLIGLTSDETTLHFYLGSAP
ncbi:MAG: hypothetical protein ACP5JJ_15400 [Anaerolineae bacterium]